MSVRTLLTPWLAQAWLSPQWLQWRRERAERRRRTQARPHELHYFHQVDDPYSHLCAQALPLLQHRWGVAIRPHLVPPPDAQAAPDRERLLAYSRVDARRLAQRYGLQFGPVAADAPPPEAPDAMAVAQTGLLLIDALQRGQFVERAADLGSALWTLGGPGQAQWWPGPAGVQAVQRLQAALDAGQQQRAAWGHYLGGTFFYEGEWYWGLDRLHHLERRWQQLGLTPSDGAPLPLFPPHRSLLPATSTGQGRTVEFFFSLRSPYSALVAPRVFELARRTGAAVQLRFVLPMVMRGLAVPAAKRRYISQDAAREARDLGVPFGRLQDPVGRPTERGLSLIPWARAQGKAEAYVEAFFRLVWSQGVNAGSDAGLRRIVSAAGLDWAAGAEQALRDGQWREEAENHRQALLDAGLWGVPSFRVGSLAVWGQDRLAWVEEALHRPELP